MAAYKKLYLFFFIPDDPYSRGVQRTHFRPLSSRHVWFPRTGKGWKRAAWPGANPNHGQSKHSAGKRYFLTLPCYWRVSFSVETSSVTEIYTQPLAQLPSSQLFPPQTRFYPPSTEEPKRNASVILSCVTWAFTQERQFLKLLNAYRDLEISTAGCSAELFSQF